MTTATDPTTGPLRGDVVGGLVAGVMSLPAGLAYGVLVFGPLGGEAAARGAVSGLVTLAVLNLVSSCCAGSRVLVASPTSLPTLALASAVTGSVAAGQPVEVVVAVVTVASALAAALQLAIGRSGLAEAVKYIPFPVRAGLLTGTGVLIVVSQVPAVLGTASDAAVALSSISPLAPVVAGATLLTMRRATRTPLPAAVLAMVAGTTIHHVAVAAGGRSLVGPTIGEPPTWTPSLPTLLDSVDVVGAGGLDGLWPAVLLLAVTLAIVASMDTLVGVLAADSVAGDRSDSSRELVAQGLGNLAVTALGGLVGAGSPSRSVVSHDHGATTPRSRAVTGLFALVVLVLAAPVVGVLPVSMLGGLLVGIGLALLDPWLLRAGSAVARAAVGRRRVVPAAATVDVGTAVGVALVTVAFGVVEAVAFGVVLSMLHFVTRMGMRGLRRRYDAATLHSNVQRTAQELSLLEQHGARIQVVELQGSLFFATADRLSALVDQLLDGDADTVVVDLRRVTGLDVTGAVILRRAAARCREHGATLLLVAPPDSAIADDLRVHGVLDAVPAAHVQPGINDALATAEDALLTRMLGARHAEAVPFERFPALAELDERQLRLVRSLVVDRHFGPGETIFDVTDTGGSLHLVRAGRVHVVAPDDGDGRATRITTLRPGTLLGEMALVDGRARSAAAVAEGAVHSYELAQDRFDELRRLDPECALALVRGIAREISTRVRIANRQVR